MNKLLLVAFFLLASLSGWAQNDPLKPFLPIGAEGKILYEGVVEVPGATQQQLYARAKDWFATTFVSAQKVIQMDDPAAGQLVGRAISTHVGSTIMTAASRDVWRTIRVYVKEGKFRYEITDIGYANSLRPGGFQPAERLLTSVSKGGVAKDGQPRAQFRYYLSTVTETVEPQVESLKKAMQRTAKDF